MLLTSAAAGLAGLALGLTGEHSYWRMAYLFTLMAVGLAFTDVLVDALMVENGKPLGLTGAFQSVQWAAITTATVIVGVLGGYLAEHRLLPRAFFLGACFPLISMLMAIFVVREAPTPGARREFWTTWASIRVALRERDVWVVGGFLFFYTFSPSFGPALLFYQTDVLHFSQQFIGHLSALAAVAAIGGAFIYAPLSRRMPLRRLINLSALNPVHHVWGSLSDLVDRLGGNAHSAQRLRGPARGQDGKAEIVQRGGNARGCRLVAIRDGHGIAIVHVGLRVVPDRRDLRQRREHIERRQRACGRLDLCRRRGHSRP